MYEGRNSFATIALFEALILWKASCVVSGRIGAKA